MKIHGLQDLKKIGDGGFSKVYRAYEVELDKYVAAKVLDKRLGSDKLREQFVAEVKSMGRVSKHPAVLEVYRTAVTADRYPVIIMEYVAGGTLGSPKRSTQEVLSAGVRTASALAWIHEHGLIHNDVKPSNVLITEFGEPKLADFGVSALTEADGSAAVSGLSFEYAAPEVLTGSSTQMSDVYSLAGTLYFCLTGTYPLQKSGEDPERVSTVEWFQRADSKRSRPVPLTEHGFSRELDDLIVGKGLARSVDQRLTAEQFGHRLRQVEESLGFAPTMWPESSAPVHKVRSGRSGAVPNVTAPEAEVALDSASSRRKGEGAPTQALDRRQGIEAIPETVPETSAGRGLLDKLRDLDARVFAALAGFAAVGLIIGLFAIGQNGGPRTSIDDSAALPSVVPTLEAPSTVVAPENLRIARVGDGTAEVTWSDRNQVPPTFELQYVDSAGSLGQVEQTSETSFVIAAVGDIETPCIVLRAIGTAGRVSRDVGPVCLEPIVGGQPVVAVVPRSCVPGGCDFRLDASGYSVEQTVSVTVIGPDGVDLNAEFGGAYESSASVRSDGSIDWFFDPGSAAPLGVYSVEVTDARTALSSVAVFELVAP